MSHGSLQETIARPFAEVIAALTGEEVAAVDPLVRPAGDPRFGDYQCNAAMSLAKTLKAKPREVAERIKAAVEPRLAGVAEPLEIAGPGFLNIRLTAEFLGRRLGAVPGPKGGGGEGLRDQGGEGLRDRGIEGLGDRVGMRPVDRPERVVIDYSQPNIAKQMHVGHLRSTIIGDVFARVLAFEGHEVIRQNHIGDWGTQFGLLIRWYREHPLPTPETHADVLEAIESDYKAANARDQADPQFAAEARRAVTELQSGDPEARRVWNQICSVSWRAFTGIYERLGVLLRPEDVRGESFYNDRLAGTVAELRDKLGSGGQGGEGLRDRGIEGLRGGDAAQSAYVPTFPPSHVPTPRAEVRDDQGAVCVFMYDAAGEPAFKNADGTILPMIIQKSDGAYLYATTDLAAIRYRIGELNAQRVIYVTDARQKLHFQMWMACARAAGWITDAHRVEHVMFGSVLGPDRKPLKTRAGGTIKLRELLDEAESRALELLRTRDQGGEGASEIQNGEWRMANGGQGAKEAPVPTFPRSHVPTPAEIARAVGIAAVKYADLRNDRSTDYVFTWEKMISFQGNTAPYMMYAYARVRSIYRKAAEQIGSPDVYAAEVAISVREPAERALALRLARLRDAIDQVAADLTPHTLCTYLYDLAADFMRFYETCPVLRADSSGERLSRLRLCDLTARALKLGLGLLGIEVIERM